MTVDEIAAAVCTIKCVPKGKLNAVITWILSQWPAG